MKSEDEEVKGEVMENQESEQEQVIHDLKVSRDIFAEALKNRDEHWVWRLYVALQQLVADATEDLWKWKWVIALIVIGYWHLLVVKEQVMMQTLQLQVMGGQNDIARKELAKLALMQKDLKNLLDDLGISHR